MLDITQESALHAGLVWAEPLTGLVEPSDSQAWRHPAAATSVAGEVRPATRNTKSTRTAPSMTSTGLKTNASREIAAALTQLSADALALYLKTKNFHWQVGELPFSDYHLMLDGQAAQLLGMMDAFGERAQRIGNAALRSAGQATRLQCLSDNDADCVAPLDMLAELDSDNKRLVASLRGAYNLCLKHDDGASARLVKAAIDDTEARIWFFSEAIRTARAERLA